MQKKHLFSVSTISLLLFLSFLSFSTLVGSENGNNTPQWHDYTTNNTDIGQPTLFSVNWTEAVGLSHYIFSTNNTGTWQNETYKFQSTKANTSGFNFFTNDIDITPDIKNTWTDIDVSNYVPSDATGVILVVQNNQSGTSKGNPCGIRAAGSTDDFTLRQHQNEQLIGAYVKINATKHFQAKVDSNSRIWLRGFTDDAVTLFTNYVDYNITPTVQSSWEDIDLSSYIPSDATGAIVFLYYGPHSPGENVGMGVRRAGSSSTKTYSRIYTSGRFTDWGWWLYQIVKPNASGFIQGYTDDIENLTMHLAGYTKYPVTIKDDPVDISIDTIKEWVDIDLTSNTSAYADGAIIGIKSTSWSHFDANIRKAGSTDNVTENNTVRHYGRGSTNSPMTMIGVGLNSTQAFQGWIENTAIDFYLIGYTEPKITEAWSNVTKILNSTLEGDIGWRVYANDTSNNWNDTGVIMLGLTGYKPQWHDNSTNNTIAGKPTLFSLNWTDNVGLSGYIFETNNSGSWQNDTWVDFENQTGNAIFIDGFEDGNSNFPKWTTISTGAGEEASVTTTDPYYGIYHANFSCNGNATSEQARVELAISEQSELYARGYFKIKDNLPTERIGARFTLITFKDTVAWKNLLDIQIYNNTNTIEWRLNYYNGTTALYTLAGSGPSLDTWYSIEVYWKKHGTEGEVKLWVNGVETISVTNLNTSAYNGVNRVYLGEAYAASGGTPYSPPHRIFADSVVFSTSRIGELNTWSNITKTLNNTAGAKVQWRVYANDTSNNWNSTPIFTLTTTSVGPTLTTKTIYQSITYSQLQQRLSKSEREQTQSLTLNDVFTKASISVIQRLQSLILNDIAKSVEINVKNILQTLAFNSITERASFMFITLKDFLTFSSITKNVKISPYELSQSILFSQSLQRVEKTRRDINQGLIQSAIIKRTEISIRTITQAITLTTTIISELIKLLITRIINQSINYNERIDRLASAQREISQLFSLSSLIDSIKITVQTIYQSMTLTLFPPLKATYTIDGVTSLAFNGSTTTEPPLVITSANEQEFDTNAYNNISASDNQYFNSSSTNHPYHKFNFSIEWDAIDWVNVTWEGHSSGTTYLYVWNYTKGNWSLLDSGTGTTDFILSANLTNINEILNNGNITFLVQDPTLGSPITIDKTSYIPPYLAGTRVICRDSENNIHVVWKNTTSEIVYANSSNNGLTWKTKVISDSSDLSVSYPNIACSGSNIYILYSNISDIGILYKSSDYGGTFTRIKDIAPYRFYSPDIQVRGDRIYIVFENRTADDIVILFINSTDGGQSWGPETTIMIPPSGYDMKHPKIMVNGDGGPNDKIYVIATNFKNQTIHFVNSSDSGVTWSDQIEIMSSLEFDHASIVSNDNNIYVVASNSTYIYFTNSTDGGATWTQDYRIDNVTNPHYAKKPSITIDNESNPIVFWEQNEINPNEDIVYRTYSGTDWNEILYITNNNEGNRYVMTNFNFTNQRVEFIWTKGTSSPYNMLYNYIDYSTEQTITLSTDYISVTIQYKPVDITKPPIVHFYERIISQALQLQQNVIRILFSFRDILQSISLTDFIESIKISINSLSQSITYTESIKRIEIRIININQILSLSDIRLRVSIAFKTISQSILFSFSLFKELITKVITSITIKQSLTLNMLTTRLSTSIRNPIQILSFDSITQRTSILPNVITQTISYLSKIEYVRINVRILSQSLALNNITKRAVKFITIINQSLSLSLTLIKELISALTERTIHQSLLLNEKIKSIQKSFRISEQTLSLNTIHTTIKSILKSISQSLVLNDKVERIKIITRTISQSLQLFLQIIKQSFFYRTISQLLTLTQQVKMTTTVTTTTTTTLPLEEGFERRISCRLLNEYCTKNFTLNKHAYETDYVCCSGLLCINNTCQTPINITIPTSRIIQPPPYIPVLLWWYALDPIQKTLLITITLSTLTFTTLKSQLKSYLTLQLKHLKRKLKSKSQS